MRLILFLCVLINVPGVLYYGSLIWSPYAAIAMFGSGALGFCLALFAASFIK